jgi:hypothetical protein
MLMLLGRSAGIPACDGSGVAGGGRFETTEMEGSGGCRGGLRRRVRDLMR